MAKKPLPCPTLLRQLLSYDPASGSLTWRSRPQWMFGSGGSGGSEAQMRRWNSTFCGAKALNTDQDGYKRGRVLGHYVGAHNVIWAMQTGHWPKAFVDHIDHDRANNKWVNLRSATKQQNMRNTSSKGGTSQFLGVYKDKRSGLWRAQISYGGKTFKLGLFDLETDAAKAYDLAAVSEFGEYANPNFGH